MAHQYSQIAFTPTVRRVQQEHGSRQAYSRFDEGPDVAGQLTQRETDFIQNTASFYMATVSGSGWPYIQHRGGLRGFVRVLGAGRIAFLDYRGNRQYVSVGNLRDCGKVSLFFMDYARKSRLKIFGHARSISLDEAADLGVTPQDGSKARPERAIVIDIEGFDWNCPQHIPELYSLEEVKKQLQDQISELEALIDAATEAGPTN